MEENLKINWAMGSDYLSEHIVNFGTVLGSGKLENISLESSLNM